MELLESDFDFSGSERELSLESKCPDFVFNLDLDFDRDFDFSDLKTVASNFSRDFDFFTDFPALGVSVPPESGDFAFDFSALVGVFDSGCGWAPVAFVHRLVLYCFRRLNFRERNMPGLIFASVKATRMFTDTKM